MPVKSTIVLLCVKMNGDTNTVQNLKIFSVNVHSPLFIVMVLGIVKISSTSPVKSLLTMIPMVMVKSILETKLILNT